MDKSAKNGGQKKSQPNVITRYTVPLSPSRIFSSQYSRQPKSVHNQAEPELKGQQKDQTNESESQSDELPVAFNLRSRNRSSTPRVRTTKEKPKLKKDKKRDSDNDNDFIVISSASSSESDSSDSEPKVPMLLRSKRSLRRRETCLRKITSVKQQEKPKASPQLKKRLRSVATSNIKSTNNQISSVSSGAPSSSQNRARQENPKPGFIDIAKDRRLWLQAFVSIKRYDLNSSEISAAPLRRAPHSSLSHGAKKLGTGRITAPPGGHNISDIKFKSITPSSGRALGSRIFYPPRSKPLFLPLDSPLKTTLSGSGLAAKIPVSKISVPLTTTAATISSTCLPTRTSGSLLNKGGKNIALTTSKIAQPSRRSTGNSKGTCSATSAQITSSSGSATKENCHKPSAQITSAVESVGSTKGTCSATSAQINSSSGRATKETCHTPSAQITSAVESVGSTKGTCSATSAQINSSSGRATKETCHTPSAQITSAVESVGSTKGTCSATSAQINSSSGRATKETCHTPSAQITSTVESSDSTEGTCSVTSTPITTSVSTGGSLCDHAKNTNLEATSTVLFPNNYPVQGSFKRTSMESHTSITKEKLSSGTTPSKITVKADTEEIDIPASTCSEKNTCITRPPSTSDNGGIPSETTVKTDSEQIGLPTSTCSKANTWITPPTSGSVNASKFTCSNSNTGITLPTSELVTRHTPSVSSTTGVSKSTNKTSITLSECIIPRNPVPNAASSSKSQSPRSTTSMGSAKKTRSTSSECITPENPPLKHMQDLRSRSNSPSPISKSICIEYATMVETQRHLMPEKYAPKGQRSQSTTPVRSESASLQKDKCGISFFDASKSPEDKVLKRAGIDPVLPPGGVEVKSREERITKSKNADSLLPSNGQKSNTSDKFPRKRIGSSSKSIASPESDRIPKDSIKNSRQHYLHSPLGGGKAHSADGNLGKTSKQAVHQNMTHEKLDASHHAVLSPQKKDSLATSDGKASKMSPHKSSGSQCAFRVSENKSVATSSGGKSDAKSDIVASKQHGNATSFRRKLSYDLDSKMSSEKALVPEAVDLHESESSSNNSKITASSVSAFHKFLTKSSNKSSIKNRHRMVVGEATISSTSTNQSGEAKHFETRQGAATPSGSTMSSKSTLKYSKPRLPGSQSGPAKYSDGAKHIETRQSVAKQSGSTTSNASTFIYGKPRQSVPAKYSDHAETRQGPTKPPGSTKSNESTLNSSQPRQPRSQSGPVKYSDGAKHTEIRQGAAKQPGNTNSNESTSKSSKIVPTSSMLRDSMKVSSDRSSIKEPHRMIVGKATIHSKIQTGIKRDDTNISNSTKYKDPTQSIPRIPTKASSDPALELVDPPKETSSSFVKSSSSRKRRADSAFMTSPEKNYHAIVKSQRQQRLEVLESLSNETRQKIFEKSISSNSDVTNVPQKSAAKLLKKIKISETSSVYVVRSALASKSGTTSPRSGTPTPKSRTPSPKSRTPSPKSRTPSPKSRTPSPKSRIPSPKSRIPSPKSRTPSPKSRIPSPKSRIPSPKSRTPSCKSWSESSSTHLSRGVPSNISNSIKPDGSGRTYSPKSPDREVQKILSNEKPAATSSTPSDLPSSISEIFKSNEKMTQSASGDSDDSAAKNLSSVKSQLVEDVVKIRQHNTGKSKIDNDDTNGQDKVPVTSQKVLKASENPKNSTENKPSNKACDVTATVGEKKKSFETQHSVVISRVKLPTRRVATQKSSEYDVKSVVPQILKSTMVENVDCAVTKQGSTIDLTGKEQAPSSVETSVSEITSKHSGGCNEQQVAVESDTQDRQPSADAVLTQPASDVSHNIVWADKINRQSVVASKQSLSQNNQKMAAESTKDSHHSEVDAPTDSIVHQPMAVESNIDSPSVNLGPAIDNEEQQMATEDTLNEQTPKDAIAKSMSDEHQVETESSDVIDTVQSLTEELAPEAMSMSSNSSSPTPMEYEIAPESTAVMVEEPADDTPYHSANEDLVSDDVLGEYYDKQTFMDEIIVPENNSEVIITESGPRIIDKTLRGETSTPQRSLKESEQDAVVMSQDIFSKKYQSSQDTKPVSTMMSQNSISYSDETIQNQNLPVMSQSEDTSMENNLDAISKKLKAFTAAAKQAKIFFKATSPFPDAFRKHTPMKRPLKFSSEGRSPATMVRTEGVEDKRLVGAIQSFLEEAKQKSRVKRGLSQSNISSQSKTGDSENITSTQLSLFINKVARETPDTTVTSQKVLPSDRSPILTKLFEEQCEQSESLQDDIPTTSLAPSTEDTFSPTLSQNSVGEPPLKSSTPMKNSNAAKTHSNFDDNYFELVRGIQNNVIVVEDSDEYSSYSDIAHLQPSKRHEINESSIDVIMVPDDGLEEASQTDAKNSSDVIMVRDGSSREVSPDSSDVIMVPAGNGNIKESQNSSDVEIVPDKSLEEQSQSDAAAEKKSQNSNDVIMAAYGGLEEASQADVMAEEPQKSSDEIQTDDVKLFDFNEFFIDDPLDSDEDDDDELPDVLGEAAMKRARPSDSDDDLPDLTETPSSKRRRLQLSQESRDSTSEVIKSTIDMLNSTVESLNDTLDMGNWLEGDGEGSSRDPQEEMKSRLRRIEQPSTELPEHISAVLEDNTFSEAYKKHGASLRKLVRDKIKEDKIAEMEQSLLADLKKGGFRKMLEEEEEELEGELEQYDENTKRALDLMKKDWGMLPRVEADSAIFRKDSLSFCHHMMALEKYFDVEETKKLDALPQRLIKKCNMELNILSYEGALRYLVDRPSTRIQALKWAVDIILSHPDGKVLFKIVQSQLRHSDQSLLSFKQFKPNLCRAGIKEKYLGINEENAEKREFDEVCPKCQKIRRFMDPEKKMSILRMMQYSGIGKESPSDVADCVFLLLLSSHDGQLFYYKFEIHSSIRLCLDTCDSWDETKFLINDCLMESATELNVLQKIVGGLQALGNRGRELSRIIAASALSLAVHGTDISQETDFDDPKSYMDIVSDFNLANIGSVLSEEKDDVTEKDVFYHMSLLLPLLRICLGKKCDDAKTYEILDKIYKILRSMTKRIRDNGVIYVSQVKYELTAFTKNLYRIIQKAQKADKSSVFKYLGSAPVTEEVVNASVEEAESSESESESVNHDLNEEVTKGQTSNQISTKKTPDSDSDEDFEIADEEKRKIIDTNP